MIVTIGITIAVFGLLCLWAAFCKPRWRHYKQIITADNGKQYRMSFWYCSSDFSEPKIIEEGSPFWLSLNPQLKDDSKCQGEITHNNPMHAYNDRQDEHIAWECVCGHEEKQLKPRCSEDGCTDPADVYWLDDEEYTYCCDHASDNGFCISCGYFVAGGDDRYLHRTGLCNDCYREVRDQERAEYEDEDAWMV